MHSGGQTGTGGEQDWAGSGAEKHLTHTWTDKTDRQQHALSLYVSCVSLIIMCLSISCLVSLYLCYV